MALRDVEWDACVLEPRHDRELESFVRRELGILPSSVPYFSVSPWIVRSITRLGYRGAPLVHTDPFLADLIGLVVSQDNSCRYCYGVQYTMMRIHGLRESRIQQIEQDFLEADIDPRSKLALDFARRVSRGAPPVGAADTRPLLAAGWTPIALKELAYQAAYNVFMNRLMTTAAIPVESLERRAEHPILGWLAPVLRMRMRKSWRRAPATPLPAEMRGGPWSTLVCALDGLSAARVLRTTLDEMWESPLLQKRAKALIFAVVARGLDCAYGELEALRLLGDTGLSPAEIEEILAHLGSPALDPVEAAIVPFARGTIRGRPADLQRRTRALRERLSADQIVEVLGVCSLANAVCRLGIVTQLG